MVRKIVLAAVVVSGLALTACNTIEGAGQDVSSVGKTVAKTADEAK